MADTDTDVKAPDFTDNLDPEVVQQIISGMTGGQTKPRMALNPSSRLQQEVYARNNSQAASVQPPPTNDAGVIGGVEGTSQLPSSDLATSQAENQVPPMLKGGIPYAQAQANANMPPRPSIGGLPGLLADFINPGRGVVAGQLAPSKAQRFEGFLVNFLEAMSQGFAQEGHGPGAAMRGAGAAMQAPYQQQVQQYQMDQQQKQQQATIDLERQRIAASTPSIDIVGPNGEQLKISSQQLPQYLTAGYRFKGQEIAATSREKATEMKISPAQKAAEESRQAYDRGDKATGDAKLKEASDLANALKPGAASPFGKLTPEMAAVGMPPNYGDRDKYPLGLKDPRFLSDVKSYGKQVTQLKQGNAIALAKARGESYAYGRAKYLQIPVLDQSTNSPTFKTPLEIAAEEGRYIPLTEGDKLMMRNAVFEDIKGASNNLRKAITNNKGGFSAAQVAQMSVAMETDPKGGMLRTLIDNLSVAGAKDSMNTAQQQHAIAMLQAVENAYALRSVAGFGTGSDELRHAIRATLPGPSSSNEYALQQLDAFDNQVNRLYRGVAKVKIKPETNVGEDEQAKIQRLLQKHPPAPR